MNNLISPEYYTVIYYQILFLFLLITLFNLFAYKFKSQNNLFLGKGLGIILLCFVILYMGLRPIHKVFVDMIIYAYSFERFQENDPIDVTDDYGFFTFMDISSEIMSVDFFFFTCSFLYVFLLFIASKNIFNKYWFYSFLMFCISLSFWAYGTNGIRNGLATSIFIFALSYHKKKYLCLSLMLLSCTFHQTMLLPTFAYIITIFYNNSNKYLFAWVLAIPVSLILGNFFVKYIEMSGIGVDKVGLYFTEEISEGFSKTGFRWDFLIYSSVAVFSGWYFINKKKFKDKFYNHIYNTFLIANTAWILIIQVNFSNRFAYLSWFMMGLVIIYPLLKKNFFKNQNTVIAAVLLFYFSFTYVLNVILT